MRIDKLNEECAVFGVSLHNDEAVGVTYNGLLALQHQGQEGAGIAVVHNILFILLLQNETLLVFLPL